MNEGLHQSKRRCVGSRGYNQGAVVPLPLYAVSQITSFKEKLHAGTVGFVDLLKSAPFAVKCGGKVQISGLLADRLDNNSPWLIL
jgi:hypothetical protein